MSKLFKFDIKSQLSRNLTTCPTDCELDTFPAAYNTLCEPVRKDYGWDDMWLALCDFRFTDITEVSEWTAGQDALSLRKMPIGAVQFGQGTTTNVPFTGSRQTFTGSGTYPVTFTTYEMSETSADCIFMQYIKDNAKNLRVFFQDMEGFWRMPKAMVTAILESSSTALIVPGFEFSMTSIPQKLQGEGDKVKWEFTMDIKLSDVFHDVQIAGISQVV